MEWTEEENYLRFYFLIRKIWTLLKYYVAVLQAVINLRVSMNFESPLKEAFPLTNPVPRPLVENMEIIHPSWMAGFVSAEGSFMVKKRKSASVKTGFQVVVCFRISQHTRDLMLIKSFERYLGCGLIAKWNSRTEAVFQVEKFSDITAKIIPLLSYFGYKISGFWWFLQSC